MSQKIGTDLTQKELHLKMAIDLSHELRTPLGGIVGMNELLLSSELDTDQRQFSETIHDSAKSMLQLLNDLVELAKLDAEKLIVQPQPTHLQTMLDECSFALRKSLKAHNIQLKISIASGVPDKITTDENCLRQAIIAVVAGATKYVESGTITLDVRPGANGGASDGASGGANDGASGSASNGANNSGNTFTITLPPNTVNRNGQPLFSVITNEGDPVLRFDSTWVRLSIAQRILKLLNASASISGNTLEFTIPST